MVTPDREAHQDQKENQVRLVVKGRFKISLLNQQLEHNHHFSPPGPPGPAGESLGYDAASLAALLGHGANNQKGPDPNDDPLKQLTEEEKRAIVMKAYDNLKVRFEKFKKPNGEKSYPAKTCRDLAVAYPEFESGNYWIDPNDGDIRDAIFVYCDMKKRASCIVPAPAKSDEIDYTGKEPEIWLSEVPNGMKMNYKADSNQLGFLQLLSTHATQNLTFHCKKTIAYFDSSKNNHRKGLKLMTWNDNELLPKGPQRLRYETLEDGCQYRSDSWSKTVISYTTEKSSRLPLTDVAVRDINEPGQKFWIEIGAVCFY